MYACQEKGPGYTHAHDAAYVTPDNDALSFYFLPLFRLKKRQKQKRDIKEQTNVDEEEPGTATSFLIRCIVLHE